MTKIAFVTTIRMQMVALDERKASFAKMMGILADSVRHPAGPRSRINHSLEPPAGKVHFAEEAPGNRRKEK
jgi:hypothetical protein